MVVTSLPDCLYVLQTFRVSAAELSESDASAVNWETVLSIGAGVVSVAVGLLAIWISWLFYRGTAESSERMRQGAEDLKHGVDRLESAFGVQYAQLFALHRDQLQWTAAGGQMGEAMREELTERLREIRSDLHDRIEALAADILRGSTDAKEVSTRFEDVVDIAIEEASRAEMAVIQESAERFVLAELDLAREAGHDTITLAMLLAKGSEYYSHLSLVQALRQLHARGSVLWSTTELSSETELRGRPS